MKLLNFLSLLVLVAFAAVEQSLCLPYVYTKIKNGTIKGQTARAENNNTIYSYMSIPFAKPPVGPLRFKAPEWQNGWGEEILDGSVRPPACPQYLTGVVSPSEDCLYLNVYSTRTGNETGREPAPVMVFMYGGAFILGETSVYNGDKLLANDVVLVIPNYRLGVFGFFSTGDAVSPGNYGLKDQHLALRWVQENIAAFGGDPKKVTLFGESAGAVSVIYHLISPKSHRLFHKIIAQSGTALEVWAKDTSPLKSAKRFAGNVGCPNGTSQEMVDCLREKPVKNLTVPFFTQWFGDIGDMDMSLAGTNPVVEPDIPGAFITEDPLKTLREGYLPEVPIIFGCTAEEGAFFLSGFYTLYFGNKAHKNDTINNPGWMREDMVKELLNTYKLDRKRGSTAIEETIALTFMPNNNRLNLSTVTNELVDMISVFMMKAPVLRTANILSERLRSIYFYSFEHRTTDRQNSLWFWLFELLAPIIGDGEVPPFGPGLIHADDLIYEFKMPFILTEADKEFSRKFCKLWVNFATYGNPTPAGSESDFPVWPKYHWRDPQYYVLNATMAVERDYTRQWTQNYDYNTVK